MAYDLQVDYYITGECTCATPYCHNKISARVMMHSGKNRIAEIFREQGWSKSKDGWVCNHCKIARQKARRKPAIEPQQTPD